MKHEKFACLVDLWSNCNCNHSGAFSIDHHPSLFSIATRTREMILATSMYGVQERKVQYYGYVSSSINTGRLFATILHLDIATMIQTR